jgi:hypothetical protein
MAEASFSRGNAMDHRPSVPRTAARVRPGPTLVGTLLLGTALVVAGLRPAAGQEAPAGFVVTGSLSEHPHAGLARGLAATLARAYGEALYAPGRVEITSDDCPEAAVRLETRAGGSDTPWARVVLCSGLVEAVRAELDSARLDPAVRDTVLAAALGLAYAHGVGHALSEMPASGRSVGGEPYATEFTALTYAGRPRLAHWAAVYWARAPGPLSGAARRLAAALPTGGPAYGREHGFVRRRMSDLLCAVYGADPDGRRWLVEESLLDPEGSDRCRREYRRLTERWGSLLRRPVRLGSAPPVAEDIAPGDAATRDAPGDTAPGGPEEGEGRAGAPADTLPAAGEPAPWGEAEALWSSYRARVGDVVAPLLADVIRARSELPGRVVVTFEPSPGTLDLEIYGGARSPEEARRVVRDYWEFVREEFGPYLERRFGPELRQRDVRILYYDTSEGEPRVRAGLLQGEWTRP